MSFRDLLRLRRNDTHSPKVREVVRQTVEYLDRITSSDPEAEIRPAMLAQTLRENEVVAISALYLLEQAGIVAPHTGVYCKATMAPIETYSLHEPIPPTLPCPACFEEHSFDDGSMTKELFFTVNRDALRNYERKAA
jgi:hypothetical protein